MPKPSTFLITAWASFMLLLAPAFGAQQPHPNPATRGAPPAINPRVNPPVPPQVAGPAANQMQRQVASTMYEVSQLEIAAGKLAESRSTNFQIRNFADRVVRDNQLADSTLREYARRHSIPLSGLQTANAKSLQQAQVDFQQLQATQGAAFDSQFLNFMVTGDQKAIAAMANAYDDLPPSRLKQLVRVFLPIATQHYKIASNLSIRETAQKMGGG